MDQDLCKACQALDADNQSSNHSGDPAFLVNTDKLDEQLPPDLFAEISLLPHKGCSKASNVLSCLRHGEPIEKIFPLLDSPECTVRRENLLWLIEVIKKIQEYKIPEGLSPKIKTYIQHIKDNGTSIVIKAYDRLGVDFTDLPGLEKVFVET